MFKKLALALGFALFATCAVAQPVQCPDRPAGDQTNACANTRFVIANAGGGGSMTPLPNGQIYIGNLSDVAQARSMTQDCSISNTGVITCTRTNNVLFASSATIDTTNAANITSGRLNSAARLPTGTAGYALTGNGASDSTYQGFLNPGTGAVTRTWNAKGVDTVNLNDFTTCDGVSDNWAGMTNAIAYLNSLGGGKLLITGTCRLSATVNILVDDITIQGNGARASTIIADHTGNIFNIQGTSTASQISNINFYDLWIAHNVANTARTFRIQSARQLRFERLETSSSAYFMHIGDGTVNNVLRLWIRDSTLAAGAEDMILDEGSGLLWIEGNMVNGNNSGGKAFYRKSGLSNCDGLVISNNTFEQWDYVVNATGGAVANVKIMGNLSDRAHSGSYVIFPDNGGAVSDVQITGNTMSNFDTASSSSSNGIFIAVNGSGSINKVLIANNTLFSFGRQCMRLENIDGLLVQNNIVTDCSQNGVWGNITTASVTNDLVANNLIY